jgi:hypothetical protein
MGNAPDRALVTERKYVLTRISAGDYLLPSNDGSTLWRIYTYEEDGSAEYSDGTKLVGKFWACARRPIPAEGVPIDDLLAWSAWEFWAGPLNSRKDAIAEALR